MTSSAHQSTRWRPTLTELQSNNPWLVDTYRIRLFPQRKSGTTSGLGRQVRKACPYIVSGRSETEIDIPLSLATNSTQDTLGHACAAEIAQARSGRCRVGSPTTMVCSALEPSSCNIASVSKTGANGLNRLRRHRNREMYDT